jgi:hypothetical protein
VKNPYFDQFVVFGDRELAEGLFLGLSIFGFPRISSVVVRIDRKYFANDPGRLGRSVDRDAGAARLDAYLAFPCPDAPRARTPNTPMRDLLCRRQLAYGLHTGMFLPEHALAVSK